MLQRRRTMPRAGLLSFLATTAVLAPALVLQAGRQQVNKLYAGDHSLVVINGVSIEVSADHLVVDPGQKLHVTLTGAADARAHAVVAVLVYEQRGMGQYRNELPPRLIDENEVTLDVPKSGAGASRELVFAMPEHTRGGDMNEGEWFFGHYTVFVVTPMEAEQLKKFKRPSNPQDSSELAAALDSLMYSQHDGEAPVARLDVFTRPTEASVAIKAPEHGSVDDDIPVKVRVTNPTHRKLADISVSLATTPFGETANERYTYRGLDPELVTVTPSDAQSISLAGGETRTVVFHVKAKAAGVLGLFAQTQCSGDDCYSAKDPGRVHDGVIDAIEIDAATITKR